MIRTPLCELLEIDHPIIQAPMGAYTTPELIAAVTDAGGFGVLAAAYLSAEQQRETVERIRNLTNAPFGINHLLALVTEDRFETTLDARPRVVSTSWPLADQDLRPYFDRAHAAGALVMHMVQTVSQAVQAAEAGADIIVAQGVDGGSHVGSIGTLVLVPKVARAVAPVPVVAAGGIANGSTLAAALALGADGISMGTRFLATEESAAPDGYKQAIVASDGDDTILTEIPDTVDGVLWPGGVPRVRRNRVVERWLGREGEARRQRRSILEGTLASRERDDSAEYWLKMGQGAGLVDAILPAGEVVTKAIAEAEDVIRSRLVPVVDLELPPLGDGWREGRVSQR